MNTLNKMQRAAELIADIRRINKQQKETLSKFNNLLSDYNINWYKDRIVINEAIERRLIQYYNNRLKELKEL